MKSKILLILIGLMFLSSCTMVNTSTPENRNEPPSATTSPTEPLSLEETADRIINALSNKDMKTVAECVHPQQGLRFSPYAFVREENQVFMPESLIGLPDSDAVYNWGNYDGSGEPIDLTFNNYFDEFVYSADFANSEQMSVNERLGQGNSINNIQEFYPGSSFVEYYFSGFDEQYEGMDWQSLRLVFVQDQGVWYLVGIVHDQWTI